jgi:hypothetical protein
MKTAVLYFFTGLFLIGFQPVRAQVDFYTRVSKTEINSNEKVRVDFIMNKENDDFQPPSFDDFDVVYGPGISNSFMSINGKTSYKKTYTYILTPRKTGILSIGKATAVIDGKTYETEPVKIQVNPAGES